MDDFDRRLRDRLATLARAVPVAIQPAPSTPTIRPVLRPRWSGVSLLAATTSVILVVGIAIAVTGHVWQTPSASGPPGVATSPVSTAAEGPSRSPAATAILSASPSVTPTRPPADVALPYPAGCTAYRLSPRRCAYIVDWALGQAGIDAGHATVRLLGDPACDGEPAGCVAVRTTTFVVRVRVIATSGSASDHPVFCGLGSETSMLCSDTPLIRVSTPISSYHDVPCGPGPGGEPGSRCATPVPTIAPPAAADADPLEVAATTIPIDHVGPYSVDVGDALLPNGILSQTTATLTDDRRSDVLIPQGIHLEVLGPDGKPLENAYAQGWRPGIERVDVRLDFTVEAFDAGATLEITDIVVR